MATNIEIEAKVLISEKDYNKAMTLFKNNDSNFIIQTNYYIDTENLELKHHGIGLRIREKKNEYTLTLKAPMSEGLLEKNEHILKKDFENLKNSGLFPCGEIRKFVKMIGVNPDSLKILTCLVTERLENYNDDRTIFSIDKNTYNGITDYELEMEGNSMGLAKDNLKSKCMVADIPYIENKKSKQSRALDTIAK